MFAERARAYGVPIAFCNLVGGQDELVFDGHSFVVDAAGEVVARARQFEPDLLVWELGGEARRGSSEPLGDLDEVYAALTLGVRDYVRKNGFERALVGLSGGIDSALVALIAADALGRRAPHLRRHALPPLQRRDAGRRADDRDQPRRRADRAPDRRRRWRPTTRSSASTGRATAWRPRTSRRGSAATC